ncbi:MULTISPECIES: hypothetical protein [Legionella]|uniref:Secreted protein n=1 Tax=Legionella maceachernii TaxID=466 RepID=A0A0W0W4L2_9GAMM|nr:hypothetical protein [Legionella maceachernii]KTD27150.1 hypothetical protein Lmac_1398 [Legionella maceachernii]SKA13984.1 hypothetical protein SAMN02745128_02258 [Legionella maceachernii]SUP04840.1 Uncharacterised protein [Legionella maceachernii]
MLLLNAKARLLGVLLFLPLCSLASPADELNAAVLNAAIQVMRDCYEVKHTANAEFAKCMSDMFKKNMMNPFNYRIFVEGDIPGEATLTIASGSDYLITCAVSAQKTLKVSHCSARQGPALNADQKMSIIPP